jgi:PBSX family phage terminase large subunit
MTRAVDLDSLFTPRQIEALAVESRYNIFEGSVRSGKTYVSLWWWCFFIREFAPEKGNLLMIGRTERTLERNVLNPMIEIFGPARMHYSRGLGEGEFLGRRFYYVGANDERSQEKIRGMTVCGAYGDEITLWPESFWEMLRSRLSPRGARFIGTTNPDSPFHWLKTKTLDREDELNLSVIRFRLDGNTFLDPDFITDLKKEYTGLWYRRFIDGEWCQAEGAVYDTWDEELYVRENPIQGHHTRDIAIDYGTSNPTVFLECLHGGGNFHVAREYYWDSRGEGRQKTDGQYADDLEEFIGQGRCRWVVVDPSAASFIAELKRRRLPVKPADNDVLDGIREVAKRLSSGDLTIAPGCEWTRKGFSAYVWDSKAQRKGEDKPLKENDHAMDALRYWIYTLYRTAPAPGRVVSRPVGM